MGHTGLSFHLPIIWAILCGTFKLDLHALNGDSFPHHTTSHLHDAPHRGPLLVGRYSLPTTRSYSNPNTTTAKMSSQSSLDSTSSALTLAPSAPEVLHFAYSSPSTTLLAISSSSLPVGLAYLPNFSFTLNPSGRANIVPVTTSSSLLAVPEGKGVEVVQEEGVYGLLYLVPEEDEPRLDDAQAGRTKTVRDVELFPAGFAEMEGDAVSVRVVRALVYIDEEGGEPGTPDKEHAREVNEAVAEALEWGMPAWYAERVRRFLPDEEEKEKEKVEEAKGKGKGKEKA